MIPLTGFYCQRCECPSADLVVTETDEATVAALVCLERNCGLVTVISQEVKPPEK